MRIGIFTFVLLCSALVHAEIYTWKDSNGVTHFSDRPGPGAKVMNLPQVQSYTAPPTSTVLPTPAALTKDKAAQSGYDWIKIVEPSAQTTFRNTDGSVTVKVDLSPALHPGDNLQLQMDGSVIGEPQQDKTFTLNDLDRGEHHLVAQVVNDQGAVVQSSEPLALYMMQPRINMSGPKTP